MKVFQMGQGCSSHFNLVNEHWPGCRSGAFCSLPSVEHRAFYNRIFASDLREAREIENKTKAELNMADVPSYAAMAEFKVY